MSVLFGSAIAIAHAFLQADSDPAHPRFHIRSNCTGCKMSDPDFPFHDPVHGLYHLMFQFHDPGIGHADVVIGHVASADMVHWARLPVALPPDRTQNDGSNRIAAGWGEGAHGGSRAPGRGPARLCAMPTHPASE